MITYSHKEPNSFVHIAIPIVRLKQATDIHETTKQHNCSCSSTHLVGIHPRTLQLPATTNYTNCMENISHIKKWQAIVRKYPHTQFKQVELQYKLARIPLERATPFSIAMCICTRHTKQHAIYTNTICCT